MPNVNSADRAKHLSDLADTLTKITLHPAFLDKLDQLQAVPADQRRQFVRDNMGVGALAAAGIPIPAGLRSVVRVFEDPTAAVITSQATQLDAPEVPSPSGSRSVALQDTWCTSVGIVACISHGA